MVGMGTVEEGVSTAPFKVYFDEVGICKGGGASMPRLNAGGRDVNGMR